MEITTVKEPFLTSKSQAQRPLISSGSNAAINSKRKALERFAEYLQNYTGMKLNAVDLEILIENTKFKVLRRRQYLLQQGDICQHMCFNIKGALRMFSVNEKGQEATLSLSLERSWIADRESMGLQIPTVFNIVAVEDTELMQFSSSQVEFLSQSVSAFAVMMKLQTKELAIETQKRVHAALSMTAEERYHELLENNPEFTQRFSQNMIASYLGVKPETLSRLRKR